MFLGEQRGEWSRWYAADRLVPAFGLIRRVTLRHMERDTNASKSPSREPDDADAAEPSDAGLDELDLTDAASFPASDPPAWASRGDS